MNAPDIETEPVERLVAAVLESARYRHICPAAVHRIGRCELAKRHSLKEAVKQTKNQLHQIAGAYLAAPPPYSKWKASLQGATDDEVFRAELWRMMLCHASTRERLPILDQFFAKTLASISPVRSVLDVACGLNPLAAPWMGLEEGARYEACDLFGDMMEFVGSALQSPAMQPRIAIRAETRDAAADPPDVEADLALVLKLLPLLDQPSGPGWLAWLRGLRTRFILVSFPTRTLGGRRVGMQDFYEGRFREVLEAAQWSAERLSFDSELCFLIDRRIGYTES